MLRFIYRIFKTKFDEYLIDDYLSGIPKDVTLPAMSILGLHKQKLIRFNQFQAYQLHKQMSLDNKNSKVYLGMFKQLKIQMSLLDMTKETVEEAVIVKKNTTDDNFYQKAVEGVSSFLKTAIEKK